MRKLTLFEKLLLGINTAGFLAYLFWLVFRAGSFMYSQEGVLYLLPCLPFFFVYGFIVQRKRADETEEESKKR